MRALLKELGRWTASGRTGAVARVVGIDGSGPRPPGTAMAVRDDGELVGSVAGGCVEGAVVERSLELLATDGHALEIFGFGEDDAIAVGLTCGGTIRLFIDLLDTWPADLRRFLIEAIDHHRPVALATVLEGPGTASKMLVGPDTEPIGSLGDPDHDRVVARDALGGIDAGATGTRHYGPHGETPTDTTVAVFVQTFAPSPRMVIFGAVDFTAALADVAKLLGYHVTVCDARAPFATAKRFPMADAVEVDWPDRLVGRMSDTLGPRDAICVLTHDPKFDVPTIRAALASRVGYLGAMGSRRTHSTRLARLREEGVDDESLARLHAPIGLDLGAQTPKETAISIFAEIIARRTGRGPTISSLSATDGPIH